MLTLMCLTLGIMVALGAVGIGIGWAIGYAKERKFRKFLEED